MELTDILGQMGGVDAIARELGISQSQAAEGAAALAPAILGGFKKQAQSQPAGLAGIGGLLAGLGGGGLLDSVLAPEPTDVSQGNGVLAEIFGSKDVSRSVAQGASSRTGIDPALLRKMLPMVAMLVTGWLAKHPLGGGQPAQQQQQAGLGGMLGSLLGAATHAQGSTGGSGGGLASILDMNGDGNPLDDLLRMARGN
jgi:hypothetical protein